MDNSIYDYTSEQLKDLCRKCPWWSGARIELLRRELYKHSSHNDKQSVIIKDRYATLMTLLHPTSIVAPKEIDITRLTRLTTDDLIDRFLKRDDYRIVAEEGAADDLSNVKIEEDEDMVSEELAEIYLNQGLYDDAINTYRKLSLLNSEKSIYFAELIAEIEEKKKK
jgi:dipeptidase